MTCGYMMMPTYCLPEVGWEPRCTTDLPVEIIFPLPLYATSIPFPLITLMIVSAPRDIDVPAPVPVPDVAPDAHTPRPSSPPPVEPKCMDIHVIKSTVQPRPPTPPHKLSPINEAGPSHRSPSPPVLSPLSPIPPPTPGWLEDVDEDLLSLPSDLDVALSTEL
ncbi:leucine-rich repeat extensin-like protein 3 [Abrus precatorius]|uniref:Leucine-rich repeat extensin-like protein 3 n=1 Tax=Abrus precatorius TaxID=3816 RepID=A0A8B8LLB9_ABRPR|nr:leucine-rich repeat extensin-like protein 3 [Abrus precatorius]